MKIQTTILALAVSLISATAFAAQFDCTGKTQEDSGNWVQAKVTIDVDQDSVSVKGDGFSMPEAQFDENYRPTAKYSGYYRYKAKGQADWVQVLVVKPMRDNKKAKGGSLVFQGVEEDGGTAAYFDYCTRVSK